ncbi:MAG TPA: glucokinase [Chloroflexia bacterium]|nr:glucokinase [Chloroflexia bacterium]
MLLAGDIGGTKTDLAVFTPEDGPRRPVVQERFQSGDYESLEAIVHEFLDKVNLPVTRACFDVAGPVVAGRAKLTNLPWMLDEEVLKKDLNLESVRLLNDLEAVAHAIPHLGESDLFSINKGQPVSGGALAIIAPGTGLGEAFLTWDGAHYQPNPSEGGHGNFAPTTELEIELLRYLLKTYDHVSFERVCSGIGIPNIYNFLKDSGYAKEPPEIEALIEQAEDKTKIISQTGLAPGAPSKLCSTTLDLFVSILAVETSNLVMKVLATGGVFIGGGIPMHILPKFKDSRFMETFIKKGRFTDMLMRVPVNIITTSANLIGTASYGLELQIP